MIPLLLLSHAAIAVLAVMSSMFERSVRQSFVQGLAVAGGGLGLLLFFGSPFLPDGWRATDMTPSGTRIAGVAIVAAWALVAVGERSRGGARWDVVALTGVASSALCLYALNGWTVPALLFAGIASLAVALLNERPGAPVAAMAVAMALLAAALLWKTIETETWQLPMPLAGARMWLGVGACAAFAAASVTFESSDRPSPATPLALGIAFATFGSVAQAAGPVVALVVMGVALLAVVRTLMKEEVPQSVVMIWVVALTIALGALSANLYVTTRSAIAGIVAASAIRLWPLSLGRGQIERGILVAFVAVTAGFNAIAAAAAYSFDRSTAIERVLEAGPWAAIAALLPVALAGGVVLGASVARNPEPEEFTRSGVLGTWAFVLLTIVVGVFPYIAEGQAVGVGGPGLYVVAVLGGILGARYVPGLGSAEGVADVHSRFVDVPLRLPWPRPAVLASRFLATGTAAAVVVLTVQGLRVGFL